ncbi:Gfo/Idh/MocA family oxidoreductase [Emticicia agri]|uniref:Twin-arginine translocation signal domain-containing protein n=1 Tax=Emticicia agri TaxID=2492393 RepID=A0A4Q5LZK2_9BACT|nr:Gfo/Idh/MocA family oxidoreductase [Emticicia agri]RYU95351.1 twin-arginine translocation signal domain-containing protein [Emticicia agri]
MNSNFSRRDFVKASAVVAGGLSVTSLPLNSYANSSVDDTIKVALVGCGGRGTGAAFQALSVKENVKLVAMADAFRDRIDYAYKNLTTEKENSKRQSVKSRVDVPEERKFVGFDGYKQAIALADVVILTTPPGFRPIHFEEAVRQGKHVFMEKPVATDAPGIRRVLAAAEESKKKNLKVVVGLQRHYQKSYLETYKKVIDEGLIGDIVAARCYWNNDGVWVKEREAGQTEMEYQMRNWYYFNWLCGDHINEQHIHNIDVVNWFKQGNPVEAVAMGGRQVRTDKKFGEIYDHHAVEFKYADGMVLSSYCRHQPGTVSDVSEHLVGTKGRATEGKIFDLKGNSIWRHKSEGDKDPYQVEHDVLFDCIVNNKPINDAERGANSTLTAIMGRMASYSGKRVKWEDALNSNIDLMPEKFTWDALPKVLPDKDGWYQIPMPGKTKAV